MFVVRILDALDGPIGREWVRELSVGVPQRTRAQTHRIFSSAQLHGSQTPVRSDLSPTHNRKPGSVSAARDPLSERHCAAALSLYKRTRDSGPLRSDPLHCERSNTSNALSTSTRKS